MTPATLFGRPLPPADLHGQQVTLSVVPDGRYDHCAWIFAWFVGLAVSATEVRRC